MTNCEAGMGDEDTKMQGPSNVQARIQSQATAGDDVLVATSSGLTFSGRGGDDLLIAGSDAAKGTAFKVDLDPLNESGVDGTATLVLDDEAQTLTVQITATGLVPDMVHPQHIHGRFADTAEGGPGSGEPINSVPPNLLADDDGDGFIELGEGLDTYGPIIVPLTSPPGGELSGFPVATDGTINFKQTYDLSGDDSAVFAEGFNAEDLTPLDLREIVLHGAFVPEGAGEGTTGEVNGGPREYLAVLPVASGEIVDVPEGLVLGSTLKGGRGNDTVIGSAGDDFLKGGGDADRLFGAGGDDILSGDEGSDVFVFSEGNDRITDFDADEGDRLILANGVDAKAALDGAVETEGGVTFEFDDGDALTLVGVNLDQLNADYLMVA